jgi:hypothetical protein
MWVRARRYLETLDSAIGIPVRRREAHAMSRSEFARQVRKTEATKAKAMTQPAGQHTPRRLPKCSLGPDHLIHDAECGHMREDLRTFLLDVASYQGPYPMLQDFAMRARELLKGNTQ